MKYVLVLMIGGLIFISCKKEKECSENSFCADGFIYWGGDLAADGLGWYFAETRGGSWRAKQLKDNELPDAFKSFNDSTAVSICLTETKDPAPCFCPPSYNTNYYKIKSIKKR
jgi:hypothetical protein